MTSVSSSNGVLISWMAYANDPYEKTQEGRRVPGPTLTLLFDEASPYQGAFQDVVFFVRESATEANQARNKEPAIFRQLRQEIADRAPGVSVTQRPWRSDDPTDYELLFPFVKEQLMDLRQRFAGRPLYIHISPGTPAMQTLWVLLVETGLVEEPVQLVKTLRARERGSCPAAMPVHFDMSTLFKTFRRSRPAEAVPEEEQIFWNPARFRSTCLKKLYRQAKRIAQLKVPVMILGERGTGKTTLASWIRINSPFRDPARDDAWPAVACGQYMGDTIRSELFGYKVGAFTDAKKDRVGLLKHADGDTLFLDEIGDISRDVQRLLIKAVEEGRFLPLGASRPEKSDFRLLTATNRSPESLRRRLDHDFIDRISLFTFRLPSLREIPEDIPWLWEAVYQEALRRSGRQDIAVLPETQHQRIIEKLQQHLLPGNLRDLFAVAYRVIAAGVDVDAEDPALPPGEAADFALEGLPDGLPTDEELLAREVAAGFAKGEPLGTFIPTDRPLPVREIRRAFETYFGRELKRIKQQTGRPYKVLCDVSERTIYNWAGR